MELMDQMKNTLIEATYKQVENLESANCEELAEAMDMIKDIYEAIYYCTIIEAMKNKNGQNSIIYYPSHTEECCTIDNTLESMIAEYLKDSKSKEERKEIINLFAGKLQNEISEMLTIATAEEKTLLQQLLSNIVSIII